MLQHWIWLAHRPSVNDRMKAFLLSEFGNPENIYYAEPEDMAGIEGLTPEARESLEDRDLTQAEEIRKQCLRDKIGIVTIHDPEYPARLKNIYDPPVLLYYRGTLPDLEHTPAIGIVGTRKASSYGTTAARRIGSEIGACGGIVVSGLASGVDTSAMNGALMGGGCVVGVLGCGVDIVFPKSNKLLFRDTERYGCILSEFAPGTPPFKWNFPKRNRIISGLSNGVLVVEAPERSGSLITARYAADQGRDVFAVPGNIDLETCTGSNRLLREGAAAVSCGWDILSEYQHLYPDVIRNAEPISMQREPEPKVAQQPQVPKKRQPRKQKDIDKKSSAPYIDQSKEKPKLSEPEQRIVDAIGPGDALVDDVIAASGLPAGKVLGLLTMLELRKIVTRLPGKRISLRDK